MGWKIFAVFFAFVTVLGMANAHSWNGGVQLPDMAMSIPAAIGLVLFAFKIELFPRGFWKTFARMYAVYSFVYMMIFVPGLYKQYTVDGKSLSIVLGAFLIFGALQVAISLGLWLYSLSNRFTKSAPDAA